MSVAIRQFVTVQPGGLVEVRSPDLLPGTRAEVIVFPESRETQLDGVKALDALQKSLNLDDAAAEKWIDLAATERAAFGRGA